MKVERQEIERLRETLSCAVAVEDAGFELDEKTSTRRAMKYRRGGEIIIVIHGGKGWFDPLSERKGDVFDLIRWLVSGSFARCLEVAAELAGRPVIEPRWHAPSRPSDPKTLIARWLARPSLRPGLPAFDYLARERAIPTAIVRRAARDGVLCQGPSGSAWFAHQDDGGRVCGWEERGPHWRGFSSGGGKGLFQLGARSSVRICVTEAAIDALSLAALEGTRANTLYVSTAGGWAPATEKAVQHHARHAEILVAATDNDSQGEAYADRVRHVAHREGCDFQRLRPRLEDWNHALQERSKGTDASSLCRSD